MCRKNGEHSMQVMAKYRQVPGLFKGVINPVSLEQSGKACWRRWHLRLIMEQILASRIGKYVLFGGNSMDQGVKKGKMKHVWGDPVS